MKLRNQQIQWNQLGRTDPLWAILTEPGCQGGGWDEAAFFATGEREIAEVLARLDSLGMSPTRRRALDFGCGVGRLTQALAARFEEAVGVDLAASMIERAREYNRHGARCQYRVNEAEHLRIFPDASFDLVYSRITLQHIAPQFQRGYLRELLRVTQPGGALVFQLPAAYRSPWVGLRHRAYRWLARDILRRTSVMEMYGIPRAEVEALLTAAGAKIVAVDEDTIAGPEWLSYRYWVTAG